MSEKAYQRLLEANEFVERGERESAILAYREVLKLDPSPPQRQIAEAQLRQFGEISFSFGASTQVIRKQSNSPQRPKNKLRERRSKNKNHRQHFAHKGKNFSQKQKKKANQLKENNTVAGDQVFRQERRPQEERPHSKRKRSHPKKNNFANNGHFAVADYKSPSSSSNGNNVLSWSAKPEPEQRRPYDSSSALPRVPMNPPSPAPAPAPVSQPLPPPMQMVAKEAPSFQGNTPNRFSILRSQEEPDIIPFTNNEKPANKRSSIFQRLDLIEEETTFFDPQNPPYYNINEILGEEAGPVYGSEEPWRNLEDRAPIVEKRLRELGKMLRKKFQKDLKLLKQRPRAHKNSPIQLFIQKEKEESENPLRPKVPVRRPNESEKEFQRRLERYEVWLEYRQRYPDIDINVANRLKEKNMTLREFREQQRQKRRSLREKHQQHLRQLHQKNTSYVGTLHTELLIEERIPLWLVGFNNFELSGYLTENLVYYWNIRKMGSGKNKKIRKLQLIFVCRKNQRTRLRRTCRVEPDGHFFKRRPPNQPKKRFHIEDTKLNEFHNAGSYLFFKFYNSLWLKGKILWFDPFQLGLQIPVQEENGEEIFINIMLFRHAISDYRTEQPEEWNLWPNMKEFLQRTKIPK